MTSVRHGSKTDDDDRLQRNLGRMVIVKPPVILAKRSVASLMTRQSIQACVPDLVRELRVKRFQDSKIAQLLRDSLGNLSCRTCMIAHVSSAVPHYNESLQVIQLAARIHRMKRRRTKFSSTSSEDSSTDGDVKFRRPYRGMRMGTLREDVLYLSSHSDPDYTSSSEQSCDTVIYIGANGQSLSDRELTDNEGPPRHVPRTNPRLPRRPSGSRSSGDDSDSGRSMRSVRSVESGRLPVRRLMSASPTPGCGAPPGLVKVGAQSMPGSPKTGLVKMAQRVGVQSKCVPSDGSSLSMASSSGEGRPTKMHCHSSQSKLAKAIHDKKEPMPGEQWVDGPGAAIYPEKANSEMWVDGPDVFVVQHQPLPAALPTTSPSRQQHHQRGDTGVPPSSSSSVAQAHHHHHRSESMSSRSRPAPKKVNSEEHWVDGPREMLASGSVASSQPMHTTCKTIEPARDTGSKPGLQQTPKPTIISTGVSDKALKQALTKHIQESKERPESHQSTDSGSSLAVETAESRPVSFTSSEDQQCQGSSSKAAGTKDSESPYDTRPDSNQRLLDQHTPSAYNKCSKPEASHVPRLQKSQLPGSSSPTHRVAQWIKSVANEQGQGHEVTAPPVITDQPGQSPHQPHQAANTVAMADAETNTEHDSDFERMAEENGLPSSSSDESPGNSPASGVAVALSAATHGNKCNNSVMLDTSLDSSFDNSLLNAESVYEMEVEERLDFMKAKDGSRLAADVDNETFSSQSCSNRDGEEEGEEGERDAQAGEIESLLVKHTKVLTEHRQTAQIDKHLARDGKPGALIRQNSPRLADYDVSGKKEMCRALISRKPDGASNPNLSELFFEERCVQHAHVYQNPLETLHVTSSAKALDTSCLCDNEQLQREELGAGEGMAKLASKDKPPLPGKPLPPISRHQSILTQPSTISGSKPSCSSRSIYCTAKPLHHSTVKDPVIPAGGKLSSPKTKGKFFRGGDKSGGSPTCSSSSGVSSATSSPVVSSSSPAALKSAGKCSSPVPSSKLPTFCSSRTSSTCSKDKTRKREKEKDGNKGTILRNVQLINTGGHKGRGNDSDSGNDSGIVAHEQRLLSPYATVTKPRTQSHSSSGHGSDQSTISTEVHPGHSRTGTKTETLHGGGGGGGTSSGYESMLRDSEAGTSSDHEESGSESSTDRNTGANKRQRGTRRSRSAPARSPESSPASSSQPSQTGSRSAGPAHRAWVDTRHLDKVKDEPLELKHYDTEEVERLNRRRGEDSEDTALLEGRSKNGSGRLEDTTADLSDSKDRIEVERNGWSFDCKMLLCFSCKSNSKQPPIDV
ncbi:kinesin-like protein KIF26A [Elysia marginata]|uniref:Kinesin-like protein KIF26A n=1 Tax=Elysia marginata TaxID=1093978 RepID=A0AAV4GYT2_9GAST|nr:kinesin-like protein KIF26A [Elysia marginata]